MISPAIAAIAMINGSFTNFNRQSAIAARRAMMIVVLSVNDLEPSIKTAPAIAPIAADVTPSTNALIEGNFPYFLKYGAGKIVSR